MFNNYGLSEIDIAYNIFLVLAMGMIFGTIIGLVAYVLDIWRASLRNRRVRSGT